MFLEELNTTTDSAQNERTPNALSNELANILEERFAARKETPQVNETEWAEPKEKSQEKPKPEETGKARERWEHQQNEKYRESLESALAKFVAKEVAATQTLKPIEDVLKNLNYDSLVGKVNQELRRSGSPLRIDIQSSAQVSGGNETISTTLKLCLGRSLAAIDQLTFKRDRPLPPVPRKAQQ